jgi:hypothetical protein
MQQPPDIAVSAYRDVVPKCRSPRLKPEVWNPPHGILSHAESFAGPFVIRPRKALFRPDLLHRNIILPSYVFKLSQKLLTLE